jgi:hypothetical protein
VWKWTSKIISIICIQHIKNTIQFQGITMIAVSEVITYGQNSFGWIPGMSIETFYFIVMSGMILDPPSLLPNWFRGLLQQGVKLAEARKQPFILIHLWRLTVHGVVLPWPLHTYMVFSGTWIALLPFFIFTHYIPVYLFLPRQNKSWRNWAQLFQLLWTEKFIGRYLRVPLWFIVELLI